MIKQIFYLLVAFSLLFSSCQSKSDREKPSKMVYNEKEMIEILVDIHLSESVYRNRYNLDLRKNWDSKEYYEWALHKNNIDEDRLEESLIFYGRNPDQYRPIYEKVLDRLNEMDAEIKAEEERLRKEEEAKKKARMDSLARVDSLEKITNIEKLDSTIQLKDVVDSLKVDSLKTVDTVGIEK